HKLTIQDRPGEVRWWLARGRKFASPPTIEFLKGYGEEMRSWYTNAMPAWRDVGANHWPLLRANRGGDDWDQTRRGGANGLAIFIIALSWW
ncbi:hypothetical protein PENSPDRAFT_538694, partial [Peniophora sp. CONT]